MWSIEQRLGSHGMGRFGRCVSPITDGRRYRERARRRAGPMHISIQRGGRERVMMDFHAPIGEFLFHETFLRRCCMLVSSHTGRSMHEQQDKSVNRGTLQHS